MDLNPYVDTLRHELVAAAAPGGADVRAAAERLATALDPAVRLALMEALSQAAAEITSELPFGSVDVRLRGREPQLVVDVGSAPPPHLLPTAPQPPSAPPPPGADEDDNDGTLARITLRIPEAVKTRAEEMAARSGQSLNAWMVAVLRAATSRRGALNVDIDLSAIPLFEGDFDFGPDEGRQSSRRMTGWV